MFDVMPELTATAQDVEPFRLKRLYLVTGYLAAINPSALSALQRLDDHKGELTAYWCHQPNYFDRASVQLAWLSPIGDGSGTVRHVIDGQDMRLEQF